MEDDDEFGDLYTDVLVPFSSSLSSDSLPHQPSPAPGINDTEEARNPLPPEGGNSNSGARARVSSSDGDKELRFDIEEGNIGIPDDSMIPGLGSNGGDEDWAAPAPAEEEEKEEEEEEEDSESEDDLQIVLNDTSNRRAAMGMERDDDDDDDDDGEPLVIVADGDHPSQGLMEEQDWGTGEEGSGVAAGMGGGDGERKEGGEAGKGGGGGAVVGPKIGYSNHGYHPFHSQFKYVRPGAAPLPGATTAGPAGAPGQVRPPLSMNLMAGHGRGDWRPVGIKGAPMQKGHHPGFARGNNMGGRGFGVGLDFALPSHKTIFDVDINSFEEKPWKYTGVDMSDFFNFNLNEDSWKDYCKQLEQHRVETTMQSKIKVYEIGRGEQDYDPDMPPELAAATGIHDILSDNLSLGKSDVGQSDSTKGPARVRPPIPIGRPIQVESGYGERLPSVDTRHPRIRDSDAVIEIICQDSLEDDSSNGNDTGDGMGKDQPPDDIRESQVAEDDMKDAEAEYLDDFPPAYNGRKGGESAVYADSSISNSGEGDRNLSPLPKARVQHGPGSKEQPSAHSSGDITTNLEERHTQVRSLERSSYSSASQGTLDKRVHDHIRDDSVGDDGKHSSPLSSPSMVRDAREFSVEDEDAAASHDLENAEASSGPERDELNDQLMTNDTTRGGSKCYSSEKQKTISALEQPVLKELDDSEDSKAARSSENSKMRSGSSREHHKWQDCVDVEVIKDGHSARGGSMKRDLQENEMNRGRKNRGARPENERNHMVAKRRGNSSTHRDPDLAMVHHLHVQNEGYRQKELESPERNHMVAKGRGNSYTHRDPDLAMVHHLHVQNEGYRQKELESPDVALQRKNEDIISRKSRNEGVRKKEQADDMGLRYKPKVRESERSDQDEFLHSRKYLENGYYRVPYDKDGISRHRERDDDLKSRYDIVDDYYRKRRKDEEYLRRDHYEKEEILHGQRDATNRRRRGRDDALDPRKRDDQQRIKDNFDDYYSLKHKEEVWDQRERSKRQREREELYRLQPSREENMLKREREESRGSARSARGPDDKPWIGPIKAKDDNKSSDNDYQLKEACHGSDYRKRNVKMEDESSSRHRGRDEHAGASQIGNEEKKSRQDRSSTRIDRALGASDYQRAHEKKQKQNLQRDRELEGGHNISSVASRKRNKEDHGGHGDEKVLKGNNGHRNTEKESAVQHDSSQRHKEEASSDDEQQDSRRGRSKLERWTSQKERDYSVHTKSSASSKFEEGNNKDPVVSSEAGKLPSGPPEKVEAVEKHSSGEAKVVGEHNDTETKPLEDLHLDTVEKLKKRSERFKLPMPSKKDALAIKKMESEALPSVRTDNAPDAEIKPERPARKRRWVSN